MSLTDDDGIDGPWDRAMARRPRARCACGRVRRQAAERCQRCLDAETAQRKAAEPVRRFARQWRADGWLCAIRDGRVYLALRMPSGLGAVHSTPIDGGRWSSAINPHAAPWELVDGELEIGELRRIARDCYCASLPTTGCDFCNGTRRPDGSR